MQDLPVDTLIDKRYRVKRRIGTGGMADVYLAEDLQLGRQVALKLLHGRFAEDGEFVERFRREASSAASLSHPNVVSVFDRGEWDGTYYIAMEFLAGRSLKEIVRETGAMEPSKAIELALQLLRAARFAHGHGVVHRDLKPQNAIVDEEGQVKVTDFGIARAGASEITQTGSIMGTAQYLSPEQAQGRPVGEPSDLYSIGIVLYELLAGRIPFDADSAVAIALKQIGELPPLPSTLNSAVSPELDAIVMRALEKAPEHRFADAGEFIAALEGERERLRGRGGDVPAPHAVEYGYAHEPAQEPASGVGPQPQVWPWVIAALLLLALLAGGAYALFGGAGQHRVPGVIGQSEAAATAALRSAGFTPVSEHANGATPRGTVIAESPAGGASAPRNSLVRITVSDGAAQAQIPDVHGLGRGAAKRALVHAGFTVAESAVADAGVARGHVVASIPPALSMFALGGRVTIQVSSGAQLVAVPAVVGKPQTDATAALDLAGFRVLASNQISSQPVGTVLAQNPTGRAPAGSVVAISVAMASDQVAVPPLTGKSQVDASSALAAAGLQSHTTDQSVSDPAKDGTVLSQSPAPGTSVKRGTTVQLVLARLSPATNTTTTTTTTPTTTTTTTPGH
ncbi:MAG: protein kinase domain-containing protein [Solirubrobacteraceae bacterium]